MVCEIPQGRNHQTRASLFPDEWKRSFNTATKVLPEVIHEVLADNNLMANDMTGDSHISQVLEFYKK